MKLTEEQKTRIAEELTKVALEDLGHTSAFRFEQARLAKKMVKKLTEMESEAEKVKTEKTGSPTGMGSLGTFDY